jgi:hypothetical protein
MNTDQSGPAQTQMMGIVHSALRRDLVRARIVAAGLPEPPRRAKLAEHLLWMMDFLHHHHEGEDTGLFPLVVRENPAAGALVADMDAEHARIAPAISTVESAARSYGAGSPRSDQELLEALAAMCEVLLPHLRREEVEMMPVVAESITADQWHIWDEATNVKPKGLLQLGHEGHWLLDGLDDDGRERVVHLVPPIPRFVLLRGFAGSYRRRKQALWGGTPAEDVPSMSLATVDTWV